MEEIKEKTTEELQKEFDDFVNKEYSTFSEQMMLYANRRTMQILQRCFNKKIQIENELKNLKENGKKE